MSGRASGGFWHALAPIRQGKERSIDQVKRIWQHMLKASPAPDIMTKLVVP